MLIEGWQSLERELYLWVVVDSPAAGYALLYAPQGGVDIDPVRPRHATNRARPQLSRLAVPRHDRGGGN